GALIRYVDARRWELTVRTSTRAHHRQTGAWLVTRHTDPQEAPMTITTRPASSAHTVEAAELQRA
ncbi:MAG: hypothetical protein QOH09_1139, partial [Pseudonocardiales bacterium]|nr:hypothetical protein [Pseudonocardiales bacterium]